MITVALIVLIAGVILTSRHGTTRVVLRLIAIALALVVGLISAVWVLVELLRF